MKNFITKYNFEQLLKYKESSLLRMQKHPTEELYIWNYMNSVSYDGNWDSITETCRGLITDNFGNVVSRPFPKFFNIGQKESSHINWKQPFKVWEKKDCYLGISYWIKDKIYLSSRGSFESDFSIEGNKILNSIERNWLESDKNYTFCFEIILKDKPIVITYEEDELCLLAVIETKTGKELDPREFALRLNFTTPKLYEFNSIEEIISSEQRLGEEGYVVHFEDGNRIKWKFEDYCRLHSIVTKSTERHVWEYLKNGKKEELFSIIPDEFYPQLHKCINFLEEEFNKLFIINYTEFCSINSQFNNKKDFAIFVSSKVSSVRRGFMFACYENNTDKMSDILWSYIYPEGKTLLEWTNL